MLRLCSLALMLLAGTVCASVRAAEPTVLVWKMAGLPAASDPDHLVEVLTRAGLSARLLEGEALCAPGALDPKQVALLVLPHGPAYPAPARAALLSYLRGGGALLSLGGRVLSEPLLPSPDGWVPAARLSQPGTGTPLVIADFEEGGRSPAVVSASDAEGTPRTRVVAAEQGQALEAVSESLVGFEYLALREVAGRATHPILRFRARGDAATSLLCVEFREEDGSRWKAIVPLAREWRTYYLHAVEFRSYATPARAKAGDHLHPEAARELHFGYTRSMVGPGTHRFWLDDLAWEPGVMPGALADQRPLVDHVPDLVVKYFGSDVAPRAGGELPLLRMPRTLDKGARPVSTHALAPGTPSGGIHGWAVTGHADDRHTAWVSNPGGRLSLPREATGRRATLLAARDVHSRESLPAVALFVHTRGEFAGGRWAISGVSQPDLFPPGDRAAEETLVRLARTLTEGALLGAVEPEFVVEDGQPLLRLCAEVINTPAGAARARLAAQVRGLNRGNPVGAKETVRDAAEIDLAPGETRRVTLLSVPLAAIDWQAYRVDLSLAREGHPEDRAGFTVDLSAALRALGDEFCRRQQPDGAFDGHTFADSRAARTLLALHSLTGEKRYLHAAQRWGEMVLARQRADGGYRMGYGIHSVGEECYVADGGEIALGIARLALDAPEKDRARYRASLERYLRFREEFRCPEGGIGVGYCKTDYGVRPTVPLKEIRRIYAPELNTYTIGCTLGSAAAHAALWGNATDRERAASDARWLIAHAAGSLGGPFVESFYWAHHQLRDAALRAEIEAHLRERFLAKTCGSSRRWWLEGGGRTALSLSGLAYAMHTFAPEPAVQAELARGLHALCADESPWSLYRLREQDEWLMHDWIYLSYAGIGLADAVQPGVTLPRP